ncbi:MAG: hypothetical protein GY809_30765, partial [Planctomycetes bacterium]|nr:hypothetical protein [Planctomycetota bacterium]
MMSLDQTAKTWLTDTFADDVTFEEPMSRHTSFQVGGPAEALVRPKDKADLVRLVQWAMMAQLGYLLEKGCRVHLSPPPFDHTKLMV